MRGAATINRPKTALAVAAAAFAVTAGAFVLSPSDARAERPAQPGMSADFLIEGLESVEGCLGTELAQTASGKNCIIAWFEDKDAVKRWYYHPTHKMMMGMVGSDPERKPMQHVPDDAGPIMVIATITPSEDNAVEGFPFPISQISIEMFAPLPGGAHVNGRLSPKEFAVPHMKDYSAALEDDAGEGGYVGGR